MENLTIVYYNRAINAPEGPSVHARELLEAFMQFSATVHVYPKPLNISYIKKDILSRKKSQSAELAKEILRLIRGLSHSVVDLIHLSHLIVRYRPDFVLTRSSEFNLAAVLAQRIFHVPLITEVNGLLYLERNSTRMGNFAVVRKFFEKLLIQESAGVYVVSKELVQLLSGHGFRAKRLAIIPNGVNIEKFDRTLSPHSAISRLKAEGRTIIGFVGSLYPWHGVDILLRAYAGIVKAFPTAYLVVVGDGNERTNLEAIAKELGISDMVEFVGSIRHEDIPFYIAGFDVAVAPYHINGPFYFSPLKVYEYMAMAKPVVCSRLGQLSDLICDQKDGSLVEQADNAALCEAILSLLNDPKKRMDIGESAYEKVRAAHTWRSTSLNVIKFYKEIAEA